MARGIDYGGMMHRAMQRLIAEVLEQIAAEGLPGEHHFFITFDTRDPDVEMADWLRERYPEEMTIVIQHWYEDLRVKADSFEITLNFGNSPERLVVPFDALRTFVDPSVEFGLQFHVDAADAEIAPPDTAENDAADGERKPSGEDSDGSNVVTVDFGRKR